MYSSAVCKALISHINLFLVEHQVFLFGFHIKFDVVYYIPAAKLHCDHSLYFVYCRKRYDLWR